MARSQCIVDSGRHGPVLLQAAATGRHQGAIQAGHANPPALAVRPATVQLGRIRRLCRRRSASTTRLSRPVSACRLHVSTYAGWPFRGLILSRPGRSGAVSPPVSSTVFESSRLLILPDGTSSACGRDTTRQRLIDVGAVGSPAQRIRPDRLLGFGSSIGSQSTSDACRSTHARSRERHNVIAVAAVTVELVATRDRRVGLDPGLRPGRLGAGFRAAFSAKYQAAISRLGGRKRAVYCTCGMAAPPKGIHANRLGPVLYEKRSGGKRAGSFVTGRG